MNPIVGEFDAADQLFTAKRNSLFFDWDAQLRVNCIAETFNCVGVAGAKGEGISSEKSSEDLHALLFEKWCKREEKVY